MAQLFDRYLPEWKQNPSTFSKAPQKLSNDALLTAKAAEKNDFLEWLNTQPDVFPFYDMYPDEYFTEDVLTIGFARRFVPYKRADLIFRDIHRLRELGYRKIQLIFSGHCHPDDTYCLNLKETIRYHARSLRGQVRVAVLPDYNVEIAEHLVAGCDVWLNNPLPPREASGTSGMKVALNGGLNLSILDGWWIEGIHREPLSGWGFGEHWSAQQISNRDEYDANRLLHNLEDVIDCYYNREEEWVERMKHAIALLGFFTTHRMVQQYTDTIWEKQ
jgi:starch phosphorylase